MTDGYQLRRDFVSDGRLRTVKLFMYLENKKSVCIQTDPPPITANNKRFLIH